MGVNDVHTFVGRQPELAALAAALAQAAGGRGSGWLVTGDAGVGKSALVTRFAEQATASGARVLWGRSRQGQGAPPYWPWTQLIRPLVQNGENSGTLSTEDRELLAHIMRRAGDPTPRSNRAAGEDRFFLFDAVARLLRTAARAHPLVLILEDLHSADTASGLLADFLTGELSDARVLLVITSRPLPPHSPPGPDPSVGVLPAARRLALEGLAHQDLARLLGWWQLPEATVAAVWERTGGNPFLAAETARSIVAQDPTARAVTRPVLPEGVRHVLLERWRVLTPATQQVLALAGVTGTEFPAGVLALCGLATEPVASALQEAVEAGLLVTHEVDLGLYRFSHDLLREAIVTGLPPERRMRAHGTVGVALVQWYGPSADEHSDEIARHFLQAASAGYHREAVDYAVRAGRQAMTTLAYEPARELFEEALLLVRSAPGVDAGAEGELQIAVGHARLRSGRPDAAKAAFLAAAECAERAEAADLLARAALGYGGQWHFTGETADPVLVRLLRAALDLLATQPAQGVAPDQPERDGPGRCETCGSWGCPAHGTALRSRLLARLAVEAHHSPEWSSSLELSQTAVEMARQADDPGALGAALLARIFTLSRPSDPRHLQERLSLETEVLDLAATTRNPELELDGRAWRVTDLLEAGDVVGADEQIAVLTRQAASLHQPFYDWFVDLLAGMRALMRGDYPRAQLHADAALATGCRAQGEREMVENALSAHLVQTLLIRRERGPTGAGAGRPQPASVGTTLDRFPQQPAWRAAAALALLARGERARARAHYDVLAADGFGALFSGQTSLVALALTAELAAQFGDADQLERLEALLAPFAGRHVVIGHPAMAYQGSVDLYLGLLSRALQRPDVALGHLVRAERSHAAMGAVPWTARTRLLRAQVLAERGARADVQTVHELVEDVAQVARELEMGPLTSAITDLREQVTGARADLAGAATGSSGLVSAPTAPTAAAPAVFAPDGDVWLVQLGRERTRVRDTKGMHYLQRLLGDAGREFHVVDLAGAVGARTVSVNGARADGLRPDTGDAGPWLDPQAKAAYQARLRDLRAEEAEAEDLGHGERAARAREEIDALARELARAIGLGGRDRRAASHTERSRVNVSRAIRSAIDRIADKAPSLGHHLDTSVRTGAYCTYVPDPQAAPHWVVSLD